MRTFCAQSLNVLCSHRTHAIKVFARLFQKAARVKGRVAPYIVRKTQERVNFFALQRKRENPRRVFSLIFSLCLEFFVTFFIFVTFFEKKVTPKNFLAESFWLTLCARRMNALYSFCRGDSRIARIGNT